MAESSEISWTDNTHNEWIGCTRVSPGCQHCYAETLMDTRYHRVKWGKGQPRVLTSEANRRKPHAWNRTAERARKLWAQRGAVGSPPPRPRVFSASLSDWLDDEVDPAWLAGLLGTVAATPELDWLLLSKRPHLWRARLARLVDACTPESPTSRRVRAWLDGEAPSNVWVGTTVEDQQRADERVPHLLAIPARVRFLSCEPLLGPVDLRGALRVAWQCSGCRGLFPDPWQKTCPACGRVDYWTGSHPFNPPGGQRGPGVHWIIAGGESGHGARPMHPAWARSLRDQAQAAGVAFHFKQWGEHVEVAGQPGEDDGTVEAGDGTFAHMRRVGKKAAGRLLDGREWNEFPCAPAEQGRSETP